MSGQFKQRLLTSTIGGIVLIFSILYSFSPLFKPIFIALNIGLICLALIEYYQLAEHKGFAPLKMMGIACTIVYVFSLAFTLHGTYLKFLPQLILLFFFLLFFLTYFRQQPQAVGNLAITVFGILYLTITLSCAIRINYFFPPGHWQDGRLWLTYALLVSKMTDIGAYFFGKSIGRTQLAPIISPKKTIEGTFGGIALAMIASVIFAAFIFETHQMTFIRSIWIGLAIGILSQLGDLAESLLKRDAGVKDSSHLPGLGGVLDVVDSLVFTLPFLYLLLEMRVIG